MKRNDYQASEIRYCKPTLPTDRLIMFLNFSRFPEPEQFQSYHHASLGAIKSGIYDSILHVNLELAIQFLQI